jgi:hypothetical protein
MADTEFKDLTAATSIADDDELLVAKAAADDPSEFRRVPGAAVMRPGARTVTATVDFGAAETESARVTVSAPWVTPSTPIICMVSGTTTPDHSDEDAAIEGVTAIAVDIVDATGFDIVAAAPHGTWGRYVIHALGV